MSCALGLLGGCATQHGTSQALTVVGAAAVVVGASMAADGHCYDVAPGAIGAATAYCSPGLSRGARRAGTGLALAGVGLAAAGYALKPKGPDRLRPASPAAGAVPASPYRLIRAPVAPKPLPETASEPSPAPAYTTP